MHLLSDQVDTTEISIILRELEKVLTAKVLGDVVEFGCYVGTTSVFLAERLAKTEKNLHLYDSFEGLPPKTSEDNSPAGLQFKEGELLASKKQLIHNLKQARVPMPRITKGWFSELTEEDIPKTICFAFLDGDYFNSIRDTLYLVENHLAKGAIIVIDDYANEALPGAAKATNEWLNMHPAVKFRVEHSLAIIHT